MESGNWKIIMKIVIILPTYNEKENIGKLIPLLIEEIFPQIKNHNATLGRS
jgi:dolichol-phosphate mannosyltransferase